MPLNQVLRKNSHVLWTISIIQDKNPDAQTQSEFAEMVNDVINTNTIDEVTFCLADNLQRFRFMIDDDLSEEEAIKKCQCLSVTWNDDNIHTLKKLEDTKKVSFIKWQDFLDWPMYSMTIKSIQDLYKENKEFRNDIDARIRIASKDIKPDAKIVHPIQQNELLKRYLFEECAFQKFGSLKRFQYEIYKNQHCKAMRRIKNNSEFVEPGYMLEVYFTQFNILQRKKNISSQSTFFTSNDDNKPNLSNFVSNFPPSQKIAAFIESSLYMLPLEHHEKAIEILVKCITQEILPLYFPLNQNTLNKHL